MRLGVIKHALKTLERTEGFPIGDGDLCVIEIVNAYGMPTGEHVVAFDPLGCKKENHSEQVLILEETINHSQIQRGAADKFVIARVTPALEHPMFEFHEMAISDDDVGTSISTNRASGIVMVIMDDALDASGLVLFRTASPPAVTKVTGGGSNLIGRAIVLSGTTGGNDTDDRFTVGAHDTSGGLLYFQNRLGAQVDVKIYISHINS